MENDFKDWLVKYDHVNYNQEVLVQNTMSSPFFSVIIPVYNVEKYLAQCIDSILEQTYSNFEVIIVNDGATDSSLKILKSYADKDNRISIINQKNMGLSFSRNVGINYSRGKYLYFLDSDDYISLDMLESVYKSISITPSDMVTFDVNVFFETKDVEINNYSKIAYFHREKTKAGVYKPGIEYYKEIKRNKEYIATVWAYVVEKDFLIKNNLLFENGIVNEDELFSFKAFLLADAITYINKTLYNYRIRENSIMLKEVSFINVYSTFLIFDKMIEFIKNINLSEEEYSVCKDDVYRFLKHTRNRYKMINDTEKELFDFVRNDYRVLFSIMVTDNEKEKENQKRNIDKFKSDISQLEKKNTSLDEKNLVLKNKLNNIQMELKELKSIQKLKLVKIATRLHKFLKKIGL
jgi:glycosyltransferase involved in cell wall biosynthesis